MSKFSGKCDLYDQIYMTSDPTKTELDLFNEFKERTGGVIYQRFPVEITKYNIKYFSSQDKFLEATEKGCKYFNVEYKTLKQFNKKNKYYGKREIHFETILDLIEYYPYIVSIWSHCDGKTYIEIGSASNNEYEYQSHMGIIDLYKSGTGYSSLYEYNKKALIKEYQRVSKLYDKTLFDSKESAKLWFELNYNSLPDTKD